MGLYKKEADVFTFDIFITWQLATKLTGGTGGTTGSDK